MSKKSEAFIDKYVVGKDDWLLKHKEVIAKLLDEYETEQLTIHNVVGRSEQLKAVEKLKEFAYEVCPLHREDDLEEIVGSL